MQANGVKPVLMIGEQKDGEYYHIHADFVLETTEDGKTVYRNACDTMYHDVSIYSQGNNEARTIGDSAPLYAWEVRLTYGNKNIHDLEPIVKLMQRIRKGLQEMQETDGYAASFAEYVLRVAKVAKVSHAVVQRGSGRGWSYDDNEYRVLPLGEMRNYINSLQTTWLANLRERFQQAA